jgi:ABC-type glycerol-3-phosphate transport system substrate-binding protein
MKKIKLSLFMLPALVLTGCMPPASNSVDESYSVAESGVDHNVTEKLSLLIPQGNANESTMIDEAIKGFNKTYPNVTFEKRTLAISNYESTVRNQYMANTLPDIVWSNSPDFLFLVDRGIATPLNPLIEASQARGEFNLQEDFYTQFLDMGSKNGNYYCIPRSQDTVVTFYNKDILTKAGADLSKIKNGWTWDDFLEACQKVRVYQDSMGRSDYYAIDLNITGWLSVSYPILRSMGGEILNSEGELVLNSPNTLSALNLVHDLVTNRYSVSSGTTSGSSFEVGTGAFMFQSAAISLFADRNVLKNKIDIVSFPLIGETPKIGAGIAGYTISSKSTKRELAWAFLSYLMSYDGQQDLAEGGLHLPSIRKDLSAENPEAKWIGDYASFNMDAYNYGSEYKIAAEFLSYIDTQYKSDLDLATNDLFNNVANKDKNVQESLNKAITNFLDILNS